VSQEKFRKRGLLEFRISYSSIWGIKILTKFNCSHSPSYWVQASLGERLPVVGVVLQVVQLAHWLMVVVGQLVKLGTLAVLPMAEVD
jgi:hypothetical protein